MQNQARRVVTFAPPIDREDPPSIASVRAKIRAQRHIRAMRAGTNLQGELNLDSLGPMPRRDGWNLKIEAA